MTSHRYAAYGLIIDSEIELPELTPLLDSVEVPDVHIRLGPVPEHVEHLNSRGVLYETAADEFLLKMPNVARYWVRSGTEIVIEPTDGADDNDVRVFMLGSCVGALLHQREMLVLHAAAIGTAAGAVLFAGPSGMGKSTLMGAMLNRGYSMMVDDVCGVVGDGAGGVEVVPGYPRTRLWADSAERLDLETDGLDRTRPSLEKFERQVPEAFWSDRAPLRSLYVLSATNSDEMRIEPVARVAAFAMVLGNTYRRAFLEGLEMQAPHFALASSMAAKIRVVRVIRPASGFKIEELTDLVEADMSAPVESDPIPGVVPS